MCTSICREQVATPLAVSDLPRFSRMMQSIFVATKTKPRTLQARLFNHRGENSIQQTHLAYRREGRTKTCHLDIPFVDGSGRRLQKRTITVSSFFSAMFFGCGTLSKWSDSDAGQEWRVWGKVEGFKLHRPRITVDSSQMVALNWGGRFLFTKVETLHIAQLLCRFLHSLFKYPCPHSYNIPPSFQSRLKVTGHPNTRHQPT